MNFYNIVVIVALLILILLLTLFGVFYKDITRQPFPYTQDDCPKMWNTDSSGLCVNPSSSDVSTNFIASGVSWQDTPGYVVSATGSFDTNNPSWSTYKGAKNQICGKQKWAKKYGIDWNGVTSYNGC